MKDKEDSSPPASVGLREAQAERKRGHYEHTRLIVEKVKSIEWKSWFIILLTLLLCVDHWFMSIRSAQAKDEPRFWWSGNSNWKELTKDERFEVRKLWQKHQDVFAGLKLEDSGRSKVALARHQEQK